MVPLAPLRYEGTGVNNLEEHGGPLIPGDDTIDNPLLGGNMWTSGGVGACLQRGISFTSSNSHLQPAHRLPELSSCTIAPF